MSSDMKQLIGLVAGGAVLTVDQSSAAFDIMMSGEATQAQIGGFLMALRVRGETVDELTGGVTAMRAHMTRIDAPAGAMDVVGTGGDGHNTFNVSTAAAMVVAGCGVPVAKHGNKAASSKSGAADVLAALLARVQSQDLTKRSAREVFEELLEAGKTPRFRRRKWRLAIVPRRAPAPVLRKRGGNRHPVLVHHH